MAYNDGTFTSPVINGPKSIEFPLLNGAAPDKYARVIKRGYVVGLDSYSPTAADRTTWNNLLTYSSDQGNAAWVATNVTKAANNAANPWDGTVTAARLLETVTAGAHIIGQSYTFSAFQYTAYFIAKGGLGRDWICVRAFDGTTDRQCFFNLTTCAVGTASNATGSLVELNDGWCLCILVFTAGAGAGSLNLLLSNDGSTLSYAGDTAKGCYVAHAQLDATGADGPLIITTSVARSVSAPPTDRSQNSASDTRADPFAYLVSESELQPLGGAWSFTRTYARVPAARTSYGPSKYIELPEPQNTYGANATMNAFDFQYTQTLGSGAYQGNTIYTTGDSKLYASRAATSAVSGRATGGTFTITYGANTTAAINWNDNNATVAAAINGLASVIADGITVAAGNDLMNTGILYLTLTLTSVPAGWPKSFTMDATSLTVTTSKNPETKIANGNAQQIHLPDHLTIPAHGFDTSGRLAAVSTFEEVLAFPNGFWGSVDANTVWIPTAGSVNYVVAGEYSRDYSPATRLMRTKVDCTYYLPGVTTGISSGADIAVQEGLANPERFLNALATTNGWQVYESQGPELWNNWPIYQLENTSINIDDA